MALGKQSTSSVASAQQLKVKGAPRLVAGYEVRSRYHRGSKYLVASRMGPPKKNRAPLLKDAIGDSDLINVPLAHFADSSRTSPEVREVP
jgi:hypothetical protein